MKKFVVSVPFNRYSSYSVPLALIVEADSALEAAKSVEKEHPHMLDYGFEVLAINGQ